MSNALETRYASRRFRFFFFSFAFGSSSGRGGFVSVLRRSSASYIDHSSILTRFLKERRNWRPMGRVRNALCVPVVSFLCFIVSPLALLLVAVVSCLRLVVRVRHTSTALLN